LLLLLLFFATRWHSEKKKNLFLLFSSSVFTYHGHANRWCEQIIDFIEEIVLPSSQDESSKNGSATRVHLVGNSVGGHLAAHVAVRRPDLVASLCLLNPTPVWGSKLPGWNGHLPAPGKQLMRVDESKRNEMKKKIAVLKNSLTHTHTSFS
jgi:pimeloyl-ACP methyl ester carboxylesterase